MALHFLNNGDDISSFNDTNIAFGQKIKTPSLVKDYKSIVFVMSSKN